MAGLVVGTPSVSVVVGPGKEDDDEDDFPAGLDVLDTEELPVGNEFPVEVDAPDADDGKGAREVLTSEDIDDADASIGADESPPSLDLDDVVMDLDETPPPVPPPPASPPLPPPPQASSPEVIKITTRLLRCLTLISWPMAY